MDQPVSGLYKPTDRIAILEVWTSLEAITGSNERYLLLTKEAPYRVAFQPVSVVQCEQMFPDAPAEEEVRLEDLPSTEGRHVARQPLKPNGIHS